MRLGRPPLSAPRHAARVISIPRRAVALGLTSGLIMASLLAVFVRFIPRSQAAPAPPPLYATAISGLTYGASYTHMLAATKAAKWPQQQKLWCGVATAAAIAEYEGVSAATQSQVATWMNSAAAVSPWGTPSHATGYYGPGFKADISRDFGSDPRSLAAALAAETKKPYHQLVVTAGGFEASKALAMDLARSKQPITVFVDHALHSVVVTDVFATANPLISPSSITGFQVWDPAWDVFNTGIQPLEVENVPLNTWLTSYAYWGEPYHANIVGGFTYDPDPAVGPYAYSTATPEQQSHLWTGHFVYIRPDASGTPLAGVSADWAENQRGELIKGWSAQIPNGYTGPTALFENLRLSLSVTTPYSLAFSARGSYDPAAGASAPAAALAYIGSASSHPLTVLTTQDGLHYGSQVTLGDTSGMGPAVLVAPPANAGDPNVVVVSWIGTDPLHTINVIYDVYGQKLKTTLLGTGSLYTPALAWYQGQIWLAWTGLDSHHSLNVMAIGSNGATQGAKTTLSTAPGGASAPQLIADTANSRLLLGWAESGTHHLMVMSSSDNSSWSRPSTGELSTTSNVSPGLLAVPTPPAGAAPIYLAQTTPGKWISIWRGSNAAGWQGAELTDWQTPLGVQMGYIGQDGESGVIELAWVGTDSAHHINVALIEM